MTTWALTFFMTLFPYLTDYFPHPFTVILIIVFRYPGGSEALMASEGVSL
jgi:hypothetical protein